MMKRIVSLFILLFLLGMTISYIFNVGFVEKYIDDDGRIGEHVKTRVYIFQNQMFYLSILFGLIGLLMLIFSKNLIKILDKKKVLLTNIIFLFVLLMAFFIIGEIVLRIFFSQQIYSEYGSGVGGLEFMESIKYNSWGFRDVEHDTEKDDDVFRILIIGDSFTLGYGIDDFEDAYPRLLQKRLGNDYEVITLAKAGYSTIDELDVLNSIGINLNPDLIVLGLLIQA